jgi:hypothetical protein
MADKEKKPKKVSVRVITIIEETFDDGEVSITPNFGKFTEFEILGLLSYYKDLFQVNMMQKAKKPQ